MYAGLGGNTGSALIKELVNCLPRKHFIIAHTPVKFEGKKRNQKAQDTIEIIKNITKNFFIIDEKNTISKHYSLGIYKEERDRGYNNWLIYKDNIKKCKQDLGIK